MKLFRLRQIVKTVYVIVIAVTPLAFSILDTGAAEKVNDLQKDAIEEIIRDYILKHPEIIMQSVRELQEKERRAEEERNRQAIIARKNELLHDPESPVGGNPAGDVTVVEFFDYRCPHCKAVASTIKQLLNDDPNIRVVYKDLPILGEESIQAATAALTARAHGKYQLFHNALMDAREPLNASAVLRIAAGVGLDSENLKAEMQSEKVQRYIRKTRALAQAIGANSTPTFVIGDELVRGAVDLGVFKEAIRRARSRQTR